MIELHYKYLFFGEINNTFKVSNYKLFQESKSQLSQDYLVHHTLDIREMVLYRIWSY